METSFADRYKEDAPFTVNLAVAWSVLLAVVFATLVARCLFGSAPFMSFTSNCKSNGSATTKSTLSSSSDTSMEQVLLIIDGCNGPIRLDRETFLQKNGAGDPSQSISLLQVVNGENRGTRLSLLVTLDRFMASRPHWHADIYFDGLGVDVHSHWDMAGKEWQWNTTHIKIKVTPLWEEADNLIVQQVQNTTNPKDHGTTRHTILTLDEAFQQSWDDFSIQNHQVLVFQRNSSGPGRSRQVLKRLGGLMRPDSYFCIFGHCPGYSRDIKSLRSIRHLLVDRVFEYSIQSSPVTTTTTIVATDDIFLRQRIVEAGGLVMTFEQFWDMIVPYRC